MEYNSIVEGLKPYPMEELNRIKSQLDASKIKIYDFGTGDPRLETWEPIRQALKDAIPKISQYPSVGGNPGLTDAIWHYLGRRFGLKKDPRWDLLPSTGSKEAIFHMALCVVGRKGRTLIGYPNPGYPVYQSGTLFAHGEPMPIDLDANNGYLLEPWTLPEQDQNRMAALWVNYPHNPTGARATRPYYEKLIAWAKEKDVLLLSDECYVDIYAPGSEPPLSLATFGSDHVITFMSLSKRSGLTGYRSGFLIGAKALIHPLREARANFGSATPFFVQKAAEVAWKDDSHVEERQRIFAAKMAKVGSFFLKKGLLDAIPTASFYLWCRVPPEWGGDDVQFSLELAKHGVVTTPSTWLSEGIKGFFRLSLVPVEEELAPALDIISAFLASKGGNHGA